MGITVTQHELDLNKKTYVVTIKDNDETLVNRRNIGCQLTANGEFDSIKSIQRIKTIVASRRARSLTANVNVDLG